MNNCEAIKTYMLLYALYGSINCYNEKNICVNLCNLRIKSLRLRAFA